VTSPVGLSRVASPGRRLYGGYLVVQAVLGVMLWIGIATSTTVRSGFELMADRPWVTDSFLYPDLLVTVVGSGLSAWGVLGGRQWAVPVVAFTAGSVVYPTIYLFGWVARQSEGQVALAVMLLVSMLTGWIAWQTYRSWVVDLGGDR
jgi:hypothetical protein